MNNSIHINDEIEHFGRIMDNRGKSPIVHSKEEWDARAFHWAVQMEDRCYEERVQATVDYFLKRGVLKPEYDLIDVGCGPGRFVAQFAKHVNLAMGTDISPKMLTYAAEIAQKAGVSNVAYEACDFKQADLSELGWERRFDVVFSSITPAVGGQDGLDKIIRMSRGWCFNSCFLNFHEPLKDEIFKNVFHIEPEKGRSGHWPWFYSMLNMLLLRGYLPETYYYTEREDAIMQDPEGEAAHYAASVMRYIDIDREEAVEKILAYFVSKKNEAGEIMREKGRTYGWILWDVNRREDV